MSKERQKARQARLALRQAEQAQAARSRERELRRAALRRRLAVRVPRRTRRYGALPTRTVYQLVVLFLAVQALAWVFLDSPGQRFSVAVLTAAVLLVLVRTRRSPTR